MAGCPIAVAKTLVSMEQSYVSAAFFRHLTKERLQRHQAEQLLADGRPELLPGIINLHQLSASLHRTANTCSISCFMRSVSRLAALGLQSLPVSSQFV